MASVGINACSINNVNANPRVITTEFLPQLARVAEVFRPWSVRLFVSIHLSSPQEIGGLPTFDPLDQRVAEWWKKKADEIYNLIPNFGGLYSRLILRDDWDHQRTGGRTLTLRT